MRIRFLKGQTYNGNRIIIVNDIPTFEECRFFVEYGQSVEVQDYFLVDTGINIILKDGCLINAMFDEIELSEPSSYTPSSTCCKDKK